MDWRRAACVLLGGYALLGGLASFMGWALDLPRLTDWGGNGISIQPNAAVCVSVSGLSVLLFASGLVRAGVIAGSVVALIGGLTLFEWVAGVRMGIDALLMFDRPWGRVGVVSPGRMGPPASLSWTLLGVALAITGLRATKVRRVATLLALGTFSMSLFSLTGHLYGADVLFTMPRLTVIALQTSTFIAAVSAGLIALHPDRAPMRWLASPAPVGVIARRAIPAVIIAPIVLGWLQLEGERAGFYDTSFGTALLVLMLIGLLCTSLWRGLAAIARHEAALLASEERMQLAIKAGEAATWDLDLRTGRNVWSESHFRLLGHEPPATREMPLDQWDSAVLAEDLPSVRAEWNRAEAAHDLYRSEYRLRRRDGSVLWARAAGRFFYDGQGRAVRFVGVFFDVTDEKQAIDGLRDADRRKDEFLAMLAHELRNPLAPIRNAVQLMRLKASVAPEQRWATDVIDRQMQQMTRLIDDLLDVSRINRDNIVLQRERHELTRIIHDAIEASRPLVDQCGHEFSLALPVEPVYLDADPVRLAQVFCNLLNNAAKYTPRGGHIELAATHDRGEAVVTVRDDGIGIPPDMLGRVFDMFTQVDRSLERSRGGLGIGLTLVKRLVELHGGRVEARSDGVGQGAEFVVRLPLPLESTWTPATVPRDPESIPVSSHRLLVVDDNRDAAESLSSLLQLMGNDTRTAYDGLDGVRLAHEFQPDVAILDIGLPGLSGYDVARAIRKEPWGAQTVLIALTGWGQDSDRQESVAAGFDHHLVKPVNPDVVMELLASIRTSPTRRDDVGPGIG